MISSQQMSSGVKNKLRVLFLEDVTADFVLVNRELNNTGLDLEAKQVETKEAFLNELQENPPDLVLSDHGLHEFDAFSALALAREIVPQAPFIFITGSLGEAAAVRAMQAGAADYVLKHRLEELGPAIRRALRLVEDKQPSERLRESERQFRTFVEAVQDYAIYTLDPEGRVASWNAGAEHIYGYKADEVIGRPYSMFFSSDHIARGLPQHEFHRASGEGRSQAEGWCMRKDGSRFLCTWTLTAVRDQDGQLRGFSNVARDVTQLRAAEEQVRRLNNELEQRVSQRTAQLQEANKELEAFSYSVSHDRRAPLRHIDGFVQLLQQSAADKLQSDSREYLRIIAESAHQMGKLIDALLAFSRMGGAAMHPVPVKMGNLVRNVQHDLRYDVEDRKVEWV